MNIEQQLPPYFRPIKGGVPLASRRSIQASSITTTVAAGLSIIVDASINLRPISPKTLLQIDQVAATIFSTTGISTAPPQIDSLNAFIEDTATPGAQWTLPIIPPTILEVRNPNHPQQIVTIPTYLAIEELWELDRQMGALPPAPPDDAVTVNFSIGVANVDSIAHTIVINMQSNVRIVEGVESA